MQFTKRMFGEIAPPLSTQVLGDFLQNYTLLQGFTRLMLNALLLEKFFDSLVIVSIHLYFRSCSIGIEVDSWGCN